ncbi:MAG: hypothetical protein ACFHX7_18045 [Pseudomonadota bacterium]
MEMDQAGDFDVNALFTALDRKRAEKGLTWTGVAREIADRFTKVSPSTIRGVGEKHRVEGDGVLQMLLWLDRTPESFVAGFKGKQELLQAAGGAKVLRWDTAAIFAALDVRRGENGLTWSQVADQIGGISEQQLKNLAKGGRTFFPEVMRIVLWLGIPAAQLTKESVT